MNHSANDEIKEKMLRAIKSKNQPLIKSNGKASTNLKKSTNKSESHSNLQIHRRKSGSA